MQVLRNLLISFPVLISVAPLWRPEPAKLRTPSVIVDEDSGKEGFTLTLDNREEAQDMYLTSVNRLNDAIEWKMNQKWWESILNLKKEDDELFYAVVNTELSNHPLVKSGEIKLDPITVTEISQGAEDRLGETKAEIEKLLNDPRFRDFKSGKYDDVLAIASDGEGSDVTVTGKVWESLLPPYMPAFQDPDVDSPIL